ncbi:hypothetical protein B0T17DRAFT_614361 [Bombardia bombarda]|uniref:Uncharacterized protein n=1 Tax=Bombardia bombarda TaxID=252184 RepID=A0AA40C7I8_9PEZI|nr:hypothetical protein B0T17DRAFT_614361 [Bombardia bombarda]
MGNICGKESADPFAQPGRRLDTAPPPIPASVAVPASASIAPLSTRPTAKARAQAASGTGGKLSSQLAAQKRQTHNTALKEASSVQRRQREVDANVDALNHN